MLIKITELNSILQISKKLTFFNPHHKAIIITTNQLVKQKKHQPFILAQYLLVNLSKDIKTHNSPVPIEKSIGFTGRHKMGGLT